MSIKIDILKSLGPLLLDIEKPARYTGGEFGILANSKLLENENVLKTIIAFPDLYEVGMSNQAMRIIYNKLNSIDDIICDRVFAAAPDFEKLLRSKGLPLYGLDTGLSLKNADILMFTLGYELGFTCILSMLDISGIPLRCSERGDNDPIIIMGGPCTSNPLPYSSFIDAFWIGEAEDGFFSLINELRGMKKSGRKTLLKRLCEHESVWTKGKKSALRAIMTDFPEDDSGPAIYPIPGMKIIHNHGPVEIMRGCPTGCRFCHAGYWYRPMRQKNAKIAEAEAEAFIKKGGYREITLSSLSSSDYDHLLPLIKTLNSKYRKENISFQLPSLKVSSFSPDFIELISKVRKGGLTFAIETPLDFWQMAINKAVSNKDIITILKEAKRRGFKQAKFYFMIGLPLKGCPGLEDVKEEEEIAKFIEHISKQSGMRFNINIGTFVPKPHTGFQRVGQISIEEAGRKLNYLRLRLKAGGHKAGIQDPLVSVIEGLLSRGGERVGDIFLEAFNLGCTLEPWPEHFKRDIWESLLLKHKDTVGDVLGEKPGNTALPWSCIDSRINPEFLEVELGKSFSGEISSPCMKNCNNWCGICKEKVKIVKNIIQDNIDDKQIEENVEQNKADPDTFKVLFSFSKLDKAIFLPHLALVEIFSMAFIRAEIPIKYTKGFNPLPKLQFASPLSIGIKAYEEIASIDTPGPIDINCFIDSMNRNFHLGLEIKDAINIKIPSGMKKHSISSMLFGFLYINNDGNPEIVKPDEEKKYRSLLDSSKNSAFPQRLKVLARHGEGGDSYFKVYENLYGKKSETIS